MQKAPCALCDLCTLRNQPFVPSYIAEDADIILLGEAPGHDETIKRQPFVGQSGKLLRACMEDAGQVWENASRTNVVCCRPPQNRDPSAEEIACCLPRLRYELEQSSADTLIALGKNAAVAMATIGYEVTDDPIRTARIVLEQRSDTFVSKQRGVWKEVSLAIQHDTAPDAHDVQSGVTPLIIDTNAISGIGWRKTLNYLQTWHPAYVLRQPSEINTLREDIKKAKRGKANAVLLDPPEVVWITSYDQLAFELSRIPHRARVAIDIESDGLRWYDKPDEPYDPLLMLGIATSGGRALILNDQMLYDVPGVPELLQRFLSDMRVVAHNGKFDALMLRRIGINITIDFDTMLAHYALDDTKGTHGLKHLASTFFGIHDYEAELVKRYLKNEKDRWSKVPPEHLGKYLAWDVCTTWELHTLFEQQLISEGLIEWPFRRLLMPAQNALIDVEWRGVKFDVPYLYHLGNVMQSAIDRLTEKLRYISANATLNPNSPIQVKKVLYDVLGLRQPYNKGMRAKEGSTNKEVLEALKGAHPFVDLLLEYRRIAKLRSSYCVNLPTFADVNGRVHASFLVTGTEMGRLSVRDPALQTLPRAEDVWGDAIKAAVIAEDGCRLLINDMSQAELRALAYLTQEPFLLEVYRNGRDLHSEGAKTMFGPNYVKRDRTAVKQFNFAWVYGGNEYSFSQSSGLPINEAKAFVKMYENMMPTAVRWKKQQFHLARTQGYVESIFGRRRRFPLITKDNADEVRKSSVHMLVSSPASDVVLLALIDLVDQGKAVTLMVHDSIITESAEETAQEESAYIIDLMQRTAAQYMDSIPWIADEDIKLNWGSQLIGDFSAVSFKDKV